MALFQFFTVQLSLEEVKEHPHQWLREQRRCIWPILPNICWFRYCNTISSKLLRKSVYFVPACKWLAKDLESFSWFPELWRCSAQAFYQPSNEVLLLYHMLRLLQLTALAQFPRHLETKVFLRWHSNSEPPWGFPGQVCLFSFLYSEPYMDRHFSRTLDWKESCVLNTHGSAWHINHLSILSKSFPQGCPVLSPFLFNFSTVLRENALMLQHVYLNYFIKWIHWI